MRLRSGQNTGRGEAEHGRRVAEGSPGAVIQIHEYEIDAVLLGLARIMALFLKGSKRRSK